MANSKKSQFTTWVNDTATLRASLKQSDPNEYALYIFLRGIEKQLPRVESDRQKG